MDNTQKEDRFLYKADPEKPAIVFAFYDSEGNRIGFRQDTVGTIGDNAKVYHYSKEQVEVVMKNINHNVTTKDSPIAQFIKQNCDRKTGVILANEMRNIHNKLTNLGNFEVRVIPCPDYDENWVYPNLDLFKLQADAIEPIERFTFSLK